MQIFALIILLSFIVLNEFKSTKHVHKGLIDDFKLEDYPYVMCLKILLPNKRVETCTGSLVAELFVLTAAHCVYGKDKKDLKVNTPIPSLTNLIIIKLHIILSTNYISVNTLQLP
ncbi:unnamed protein product [Aphis gossypii]|uniref:Peptidase S1 domain-containing protein n=1 Tax=Aphis gossypii TaxID=80765 RepID=A0A9P0J726_APHGO|nr:unnamed protein product [Aphis gossypii]